MGLVGLVGLAGLAGLAGLVGPVGLVGLVGFPSRKHNLTWERPEFISELQHRLSLPIGSHRRSQEVLGRPRKS